jgi:parallel beta-helix repeat protein
MNFQTGEITGPRVSDVSVSGFTIRDFPQTSLSIDVILARNVTVAGNRIVGNAAGIGVTVRSINTTIVNNDVIGNPNSGDSGIAVEEDSSYTTIAKNVVRSFPEGQFAIEVAHGATNTTVEGNDLVGNKGSGVLVVDSPGTKILSNDMRRSGIAGTIMVGQKSQDAKVVGNNISGGGFGMWVVDTKGGSIAGNQIHHNCAGMFFEAFPSQPVGDFEVKANTVEDNTRSCRAAQFGRNFSGIGIALLGASGMEVMGNHLSGNVPSGPTRISGGIVVSTDPFFGGTIKPTNNSVVANNFGNNKPDIRWDGTGSGNVFSANNCDASVPARLCD